MPVICTSFYVLTVASGLDMSISQVTILVEVLMGRTAFLYCSRKAVSLVEYTGDLSMGTIGITDID